jgi:hypothetical protein
MLVSELSVPRGASLVTLASIARSTRGPGGHWFDPRSHQGLCPHFRIYSRLVLTLDALFVQCLGLV